MFRKYIFIVLALLLQVSLAQAGEAGRVVFVVGKAQVGAQDIALGASIAEGSELMTGPDGYVYLKTIDDGFLILRPGSRARIVAYHIDAANPANTRIKLELLNGVARTISGQGAKHARQNFRFNTPVAAIGVRGTDFTVFTDQETSRVAVISGGVVVSGFSGNCGPEGAGPCEGSASRELFANQTGQLLQVRKGQAVPQLLPSQGLSPDLSAPPRTDEPSAKSSGANRSSADVNLDAHKSASLRLLAPPSNGQIEQPGPITNVPGDNGPVAPVEQQRQIVWGRWQAILDKAPTVDIAQVLDDNGKRLATNSYFAIMQTKGVDWQPPTQGVWGFALKQSEAYILDEPSRKMAAAKVENGQLQIDFGKASFATSFDLVSQTNQRYKFQALGDVARDGQLFGANQFDHPTNMAVQGVVGPDNGGAAAYIFQGRVSNTQMATGATYWSKN